MTGENYSLADIRAVTGGAEGGMGSWIWIIIFILLIAWGGGGAFGGGGGRGANAYVTVDEFQSANQFQALDRKINQLGDGLCASTYNLNNSIMGEGRNLQMQVANCCCETNRNIDSVRYDAQLNTERILKALSDKQIADLTAENQRLYLNTQLCGVVRYPNATTYTAGFNPFYGGYGCGCGCPNNSGTSF